MKYRYILLVFLSGISFIFAQSETSLPGGKYLVSGISIGTGNVKDSGTSPLTYKGPSAQAPLEFRFESSTANFGLGTDISYLFGLTDDGYLTNYLLPSFYIEYLHAVRIGSNPSWQYRLGGRFETSFSTAINNAYQNASFNMDVFSSLFASAEARFNFSRPVFDRTIWKIRIHLPQRQYQARAKLDFPCLLFNGRPTFSYVNQPEADPLDRHYFFGGFRMRTHVAIRKYLPNGNAVEYAYIWQMYQSGQRDIYSLEYAWHQFQLAFYFKLD